MKIRFLLIGTSLSLIPQTINAQCVATQDCATLGYTETSCSGGSGVKCPFGNKWACFKSESEFCNEYGFTQTCTGTNQTGGGSKACNGKYNYCSCVDGYNWDATNGKCKSDHPVCEVGTLYYSDNTCSDKLENSKTLLGVVIHSNGASGGGWIMTITPLRDGYRWGGSDNGTNIPGLTQCASISCLTDIHASCTNTDLITNYGNSSEYPAAWAAKNYKPTGTPSGKSWCLPSGGLLHITLDNNDILTKVNAGIITAGGTKLGYGSSYHVEHVLSSSRYNPYAAWSFEIDPDTGWSGMSYGAANGTTTRPVMAF